MRNTRLRPPSAVGTIRFRPVELGYEMPLRHVWDKPWSERFGRGDRGSVRWARSAVQACDLVFCPGVGGGTRVENIHW